MSKNRNIIRKRWELTNYSAEIQAYVLKENIHRLRLFAAVGGLVNIGVTIASLLNSYYGPIFIQSEIYIRLLWIALSGLFLIGTSKQAVETHKDLMGIFLNVNIATCLVFAALVSALPFADHSYVIVFYANMLLVGTLLYLSDIEMCLATLPSLFIIGGLYIVYPESVMHQQSNLVNVVSITFFAAIMAHMNFNSKRAQYEAMKVIEAQHEELHRLSNLDELTGLANRRRINENLETLIKESSAYKTPLGILMIDIDYFKLYNDQYGHLQGDQCLVEVAGVLSKVIDSDTGFVGRFGGEEFLILLPHKDATAVNLIAERICSAVRNLNVKHERSPFGIATVSIGGAVKSGSEETTKNSLVETADKTLYKAKLLGRNQVVIRV